MPSALVALVILDAFPHRPLRRELTPSLCALAESGGFSASGGRAVLSASTYPNHATFVTGVDPIEHGILTSRVLSDGSFRPAQEIGPAAPTLFDDCKAAGRRAVAVFGDQNLVGVCGAQSADMHWPPDGVLPEGAARGALGFAADRAVVEALDDADVESAALLVVQLDEVDTARHLYGPHAPEALEQCRATDAALGALLERLQGRWDETLVIALSDHDHEEVAPGAIDLEAEARARGLDVLVDQDGTAALVVGRVEESVLLELPGVVGCASLGPERTLVWGERGQQFGVDWGLKGHHGSPRTATQLAVVGGGHPVAAELGRRLSDTTPPAASWAGVIRELIGLRGLRASPAADGRDVTRIL
jgi:predicted AlkP superfamily pyrophosphatase or phosphodiesterase